MITTRAPFPPEASAMPELQWVETHNWQIETAHADIGRIECPTASDLQRRPFLLAERWARNIIARQMLERPGAFERAHQPELAEDPAHLLENAEAILYGTRTSVGAPGYRYDTAWLERLGKCIASDDLDIFMMLHVSDTGTPEDLRLAWLLQTLVCLQRTALEGEASRVELVCYVLQEQSVKSTRCHNLIGLGVAMMITNPKIPKGIRETLSYMISEDMELHVLPSELIIKKLCPRVIPHWHLISTLGLSIGEAYNLAFGFASEEPTPLPILSDAPL